MSHSKSDLSLYWSKITYAFPILVDSLKSDCSCVEFRDIIQMIVGLGVHAKIRDLVIIRIEDYLRRRLVPEFWVHFTKNDDDLKGFQIFERAINDLYNAVIEFSDILKRLQALNDVCSDNKLLFAEKNVILGFKQILRASLLSQIPLDYQVIIEQFYKISFNAFDNETVGNDSEMSEDTCCPGCDRLHSTCNCKFVMAMFHEVNRKLMELQLLERLVGHVLTNFIQVRIESHIQKLCADKFQTSYIRVLEDWLQTTVMTWLTRIYYSDATMTAVDNKSLQTAIAKFRQQLYSYMYLTYTKMRIDVLFNIIIEYPDSQPAVDDIKMCLDKTDLRATLCSSLQQALETRLLHPGVNTPDILTAYISTIRTLRYLDPSGVILETVTKPVRHYLRYREDTVRSVVSSLTDEGIGNELAEELAKFSAESVNIENEDDIAWDEWCPDPVDADPKVNANDRKGSDIISLLVNVYGSKELFVNEYRTLLADRLLAQNNINTEKEIKYLELLKIRFGETQLHFCEVMLKDISDSKRINSLIDQDIKYAQMGKSFLCNAMILSAQFWPPFKDESLELPDQVKEHMEAYRRTYASLKGNRTLCWKPHLGIVNIIIEFNDKKLDLTVSPFNATLILHFQDKPEWSLDQLQQVMKVPVTVLRRKITYWLSMGLLMEKSPDYFVLMEGNNDDKTGAVANQVQDMVCEEEAESAMASAHDQREGELQVFWSYIVGMLTNLESLSLDRIHLMLKMFASQAPGAECTQEELRQFLETKVRVHELVYQAGMYKLPK